MSQIVTLTMNPAVDMTLQTRQVEPNTRLRCSEPRYEPGGGGINVSRVLHEFGEDALAIWTRGGINGDRYADMLQQAGIRYLDIAIGAETRENTVVTENSSDDQYRYCQPGPELSDGEVARCLEEVEACCERESGWLVISGSLPRAVDDGFYRQVIDRVQPKTQVIVDTS